MPATKGKCVKLVTGEPCCMWKPGLCTVLKQVLTFFNNYVSQL